MADHKRWPQPPPDANDLEYDEFWLAALEPYSITEKAWACPSIVRISQVNHQREKLRPEDFSRLHYMPTDFDEKPMTPHLYPTHPWLMEIGSVHGRGNIIIQADGTVKELKDIMDEHGIK